MRYEMSATYKVALDLLATLWWQDTKQTWADKASAHLEKLMEDGLWRSALQLALEVMGDRYLEEGSSGVWAGLNFSTRGARASWNGQWTEGRWLSVDFGGPDATITWETGTPRQSRFIVATIEGAALDPPGSERRANSDPDGVAKELGVVEVHDPEPEDGEE